MEEQNMEFKFEGLEETKGFFDKNQNILVNAGVGVAAFGAGYFTRRAQEKAMHEKQLKEIGLMIEIVHAAMRGEDQYSSKDGKTYETKGYYMNNLGELQVFIMNEVLKDKKVNKDIKKRYRDLLARVAKLGELVRETEIEREKEIIREN